MGDRDWTLGDLKGLGRVRKGGEREEPSREGGGRCPIILGGGVQKSEGRGAGSAQSTLQVVSVKSVGCLGSAESVRIGRDPLESVIMTDEG